MDKNIGGKKVKVTNSPRISEGRKTKRQHKPINNSQAAHLGGALATIDGEKRYIRLVCEMKPGKRSYPNLTNDAHCIRSHLCKFHPDESKKYPITILSTFLTDGYAGNGEDADTPFTLTIGELRGGGTATTCICTNNPARKRKGAAAAAATDDDEEDVVVTIEDDDDEEDDDDDEDVVFLGSAPKREEAGRKKAEPKIKIEDEDED
ncbi:hypothetical protein F4778DRAFT_779111 [Xylariomycetidae sp. FL2044]|nr:hypothetical protein F4778DRAFT_779111 [Xylariomycetidae sp. FL2044]